MKILYIAPGFLPFEFSENIVSGKLVLALVKEGHIVNVISRIDEGPTYNSEWSEPWFPLKAITHTVLYSKGNQIKRLYDICKDLFIYKYPIEGLRWADHAYKKSIEFIKEGKVDIIMTRSPTDIAHLVGLRIKKNFNIKWLANWNDPAAGIWPEPYEINLPFWKKLVFKRFTREVLNHADINTFPSKLLCAHFKEHFDLDSKHTKIIPHIFLPDFRAKNTEPISEYLHICHSGNLSRERDPRNLLLAIKKFISNENKNIFVDVLGVASEEISKLVEELDLEQNVSFLSPLPYFEALKKMQEYDVLLILEAQTVKGIFLPSKITDYAQLEKPIFAVSPKVSEVGNLLQKYNGGLVSDNGYIDDIYNKLHLLFELKSENKLQKLTSNSSLKDYLGSSCIMKKYSELLDIQ